MKFERDERAKELLRRSLVRVLRWTQAASLRQQGTTPTKARV